MSRHRFLVANWTDQSDGIALPDDEAHHARVLRLRDGEEIEIFDGRGASCIAKFEGATTVSVRQHLPTNFREAQVDVTLAVPALKKDRFEWLIEKATEVGVRRIIVFQAQRSVAKPSARRRERWAQTAVSATKQSGRTIVPDIEEAKDLSTALARDQAERILLHESGEYPPLAQVLATATGSVLLAIGPEGGFSDEEVAAALEQPVTVASLGTRILRAETAAITAVALAIQR